MRGRISQKPYDERNIEYDGETRRYRRCALLAVGHQPIRLNYERLNLIILIVSYYNITTSSTTTTSQRLVIESSK